MKFKINVVPSLTEEYVYFIFNGINERKLIVDDDMKITNDVVLAEEEKKYLKLLGFR